MEELDETHPSVSEMNEPSPLDAAPPSTRRDELDKINFSSPELAAKGVYPPALHENELQFHLALRNNDDKILSLLNQNSGSYYSFRGLMRKLKLHQQSLARALNRLEQSGLIIRSPNGYRLNLNEQQMHPLKGQKMPRNQSQGSFHPLVQTYIPKSLTTRNIIDILGGRWFGRLRWIGLTENEIGCSLHWTNEENSFQVNLKIIWDSVLIETNAISNSDKAEAMIGSFKMFEQITKLLQTTLQNKDPRRFLHGHFLS